MKTGLLLNFIIELPAVSIVHVHKKSGADFCSQDLEKLGTIPWHWQAPSCAETMLPQMAILFVSEDTLHYFGVCFLLETSSEFPCLIRKDINSDMKKWEPLPPHPK
ncbi:hypothetical protein M405DRAFT_447093 [Rhizopogon salebrosus TDB-379]|nr:hypothetical protein M405DRAFT_447093 [Rhizopogon salebrosus TDB-379]